MTKKRLIVALATRLAIKMAQLALQNIVTVMVKASCEDQLSTAVDYFQ